MDLVAQKRFSETKKREPIKEMINDFSDTPLRDMGFEKGNPSSNEANGEKEGEDDDGEAKSILSYLWDKPPSRSILASLPREEE